MNEKMIAICTNPYRDTDYALTRKAVSILNEAGFETVVCAVYAEDGTAAPTGLHVEELSSVTDRCSLIIVIGGDGTMLSVIRRLNGLPIPVCGVNLGTKGFMTALEPEDLPRIVDAANGNMSISRRMMLKAQLLRDGEVIYTDHALNDVVIHGYGDCVRITALCNGNKVTAFSGDGIIIAAPTGSTGYSMSAGGPIVEPDARNIILSPICAHMMGARSFVLHPDRTVTAVCELQHGRKAYLSVDGNSVFDLANGDRIIVDCSERETLMADLGIKSFYDITYEKLT